VVHNGGHKTKVGPLTKPYFIGFLGFPGPSHWIRTVETHGVDLGGDPQAAQVAIIQASLEVESLIEGTRSRMMKGMLLEALSRDADRIAQVGRIAREQAHAAGVPCYYIDELGSQGSHHRHDPDGTRHVLGDEDVIVNSLPP
jgi:hypothetical protein